MPSPTRFWNWLQQLGHDLMRGLAMNGCAQSGVPYPQELLDEKTRPGTSGIAEAHKPSSAAIPPPN